MVDPKILQDVNYPSVSVSALLSADNPKKMMGDAKAYVSVVDEADEDRAIARYLDYQMTVAFKSDDINPQVVVEKICTAALSISPYPLKLMNANGDAEQGLSVFPEAVEAPGLYSQNTRVNFKRFSYAGNAVLIAYGKAITENILTQEGLTSFYEIAGEAPERAKSILKKSALRDHRDDLASRLAEIYAEKRQQHITCPVDQTLKQIHFPVNKGTGDYHLLSIVNHGGLRKGLSDYMTLSRSEALTKVGKTEIVNLRYPTHKMKVGGTNSQNSGEIINGMGGVVRMLTSIPPTYRKPNGISEGRLSAVASKGNIFQLMAKRRVTLDDPAKPFHGRLLDVLTTNNLRNRTVVKRVFADLLRDVMSPVLSVVDNIDTQDEDFFSEMPLSMRKWLDPDRFPGSLTADDYRELTDLCLDQFFKKVNIVKGGEPHLLNDLMTGHLRDAITIFLRSH